MPYKINFESYQNNFALPKDIIDDDFENLDPIFLKVILIIYKNSDKNYSTNLLSNLLSVSEGKIKQAVDFWVEKSLLVRHKEQAINPNVLVFSKSVETVPIQNTAKIASKELTYLLECMENLLQRPVTSAEHKTIVNILEVIKLPADVVLMAIDYCVSIDKVNARYFEKVCASWSDNGINTHEMAEQYLSLLKNKRLNENKVKQTFGIDGRNLTDNERDFVCKWFDTYKFDVAVIKLAFEKTVTAIGKISFPYINKIMLSWYENGYKTIEDILPNQASPNAQKGKNNNSSYDIDELEKYWDKVPKLN